MRAAATVDAFIHCKWQTGTRFSWVNSIEMSTSTKLSSTSTSTSTTSLSLAHENTNWPNRRRALRIIYSYTNDMPYISALYCAAITSLANRREQLSRKFFKSILQPSCCLSSLLPNLRDPSITTRLKSANKFPHVPSCTRKYQTFISYALSQYQSA